MNSGNGELLFATATCKHLLSYFSWECRFLEGHLNQRTNGTNNNVSEFSEEDGYSDQRKFQLSEDIKMKWNLIWWGYVEGEAIMLKRFSSLVNIKFSRGFHKTIQIND